MKVTGDYLEKAFKAYFETMELCVKGRAYWALLHVLVVIPDICAAMEHADGEAKEGRYRNWCKRYLSDPRMKPEDWYRLRCLVLHQGRTRDHRGKSQYDCFRFGHLREETISNMHLKVESGPDRRLIHLDVSALWKEVRRAVDDWFVYIEKEASDKVVKNVERNVQSLAQKAVILETPLTDSILNSLMSVTASPRIP